MTRQGRELHLNVTTDAPLCPSGKRGFRTEEAAQRELDRARYVRRKDGKTEGRTPGTTETGYYQCQALGCGWYHLTSDNRQQRRSRVSDKERGRRRRRR